MIAELLIWDRSAGHAADLPIHSRAGYFAHSFKLLAEVFEWVYQASAGHFLSYKQSLNARTWRRPTLQVLANDPNIGPKTLQPCQNKKTVPQ
jgi:hypothetical protein